MSRDKPFIYVTVDGAPVADIFYTRLVSASIVDSVGQDSDNIELVFDDARNELEAPAEGAVIVVMFGFQDGGQWVMGTYTVEQVRLSGGDGGEFLYLTGRSADMLSDLKEPLSEHFDEMTVGEIVEELAGRHGLEADVSPEIAGEKLDYAARIEQSVFDFATRLADRFGALFSVKGGKMLMIKRGAGLLPSVTIGKTDCESWDIETNPRANYGEIAAKWFDRDEAATVIETVKTGREGPSKRLMHVFPSKEEALKAAESESERMNRATGSGSITLAGLPEVAAEADVYLTGFRSEINGHWRAASVRHQFDETFMTSIELEAPETGAEL